MEKDVAAISEELYEKLKDNDEVLGAGVAKNDNVNYIIIYITKATNAIIKKIPSKYRGVNVRSEITRSFSM